MLTSHLMWFFQLGRLNIYWTPIKITITKVHTVPKRSIAWASGTDTGHRIENDRESGFHSSPVLFAFWHSGNTRNSCPVYSINLTIFFRRVIQKVGIKASRHILTSYTYTSQSREKCAVLREQSNNVRNTPAIVAVVNKKNYSKRKAKQFGPRQFDNLMAYSTQYAVHSRSSKKCTVKITKQIYFFFTNFGKLSDNKVTRNMKMQQHWNNKTNTARTVLIRLVDTSWKAQSCVLQ